MGLNESKVCGGRGEALMQARKIVGEAVDSLVASHKSGDARRYVEACRLVDEDYLQLLYDGAVASLDIYRELVRINGLIDRRMLKQYGERHLKDAASEVHGHIKVFDEIADRYTAKLPKNISTPENECYDGRPKVSVIVPVYRVQMYICDCLDSVLAQTFQDFEVICVDDGSTDASSLALDHYAMLDRRIRWIRIENNGIGGARNKGIDAARGEYVLFVDGDDKLQPETLAELVDLADRKNLDHIAFRAHVFPNDDDVARDKAKQIASFRELYDVPDRPEYRTPQTGARLMIALLKNSRDLVVNASMRFMRLSRLREENLRFKPKIIHEDCIFTPAAMIAARRAVSIDKRYYLRRIRSGSIMTSSGMAVKHLVGLVCAMTAHMETILMNAPDIDTVQALEAYLDRISRQIARVKLSKEEEREFLPEVLRHVSPRMKPMVNALLSPMISALQNAYRHSDNSEMTEEVESLKQSEAYRVGMVITYPLRKVWATVKYLRSNGFAYAVKRILFGGFK